MLDVACGTGVLARTALERAASVTAIDRNPGMLEVARNLSQDVHWRQALAEELPFEPKSFDAVLSQFGLMFFDDRARALREMWRVLKPGGSLVVAVWGKLGDSPGYSAMAGLLQRLFGAEIARELEAPYALGDETQLRALFEQADIPNVQLERVQGLARFPSIEAWVHTDIRGWTLAEKLTNDQHQELLSAAQRELPRFADLNGQISFQHDAWLISAAK